MAILWIVEPNSSSENGLAPTLMGSFAVRTFATLERVITFAKIKNQPKPGLVLVNIPPNTKSKNALNTLQKHGNIPICFIGSHWSSQTDSQIIHSWVDGLDLCYQVNCHLQRHQNRLNAHQLSFRDIEFDSEHFALHFPITGQRDFLPKKEALILMLLLKRPGECVKRQEIKSRVWPNLVITERTIDSHVSRLRKRLLDTEATIQSVYGDGYMLT